MTTPETKSVTTVTEETVPDSTGTVTTTVTTTITTVPTTSTGSPGETTLVEKTKITEPAKPADTVVQAAATKEVTTENVTTELAATEQAATEIVTTGESTDQVVISEEAVKKEEEEEVVEVTNGWLYKRSQSKILPQWSRRYFVFGEDKIELANLAIYHGRNVKSPKPAVTPAPVEGESAAAAETEDEYEKQNKTVFANIAHATHTGKGLLLYYKSDKEQHRRQPHGIINLSNVNPVEKDTVSGRTHAFTITTDTREYHLQADSDKHFKSWSKTIENKLEEAKVASKDITNEKAYKETYSKLVNRKAFVAGRVVATEGVISDSDLISSGDEIEESEATPKLASEKRKSTFPFSFFGPKKPTDAVGTDAAKVAGEGETTEESPKTNVEEAAAPVVKTDDVKVEKSDVESPRKNKPFSFNLFGAKSKSDIKEETNEEVGDITAAETSATAETTEIKKEDEKKESIIQKIIGAAKKATTPKEETKEEATKDNDPTTDTPTETADATKIEVATDAAEAEPLTKPEEVEKEDKDDKVKDPELEEEPVEKEQKGGKNLGRRITQFFKKPKAPKTEEESVEELKSDEQKSEESKAEEPKVEEPKVEESAETGKEAEEKAVTSEQDESVAEKAVEKTEDNSAEAEDKTDLKRNQSLFKRFDLTSRFSAGGNLFKRTNSHPAEEKEGTPKEVSAPSESALVEENVGDEETAVKEYADNSRKFGYLQKKPQLFPNYQSRYFVFTQDGTLRYYASHKGGASKDIKITRDVTVKQLEETKFAVETKTRTFSLLAETPELRTEWINVLNEFIESLPEPTKEVEHKKEASTSLNQDLAETSTSPEKSEADQEQKSGEVDINKEVTKAYETAVSEAQAEKGTTTTTTTTTNSGGVEKTETTISSS